MCQGLLFVQDLETRAELSTRANAEARKRGLDVSSDDYILYVQKYIQPRGIPPKVVEHVILNGEKTFSDNGTFIFNLDGIKVVTNKQGDVVTVMKAR